MNKLVRILWKILLFLSAYPAVRKMVWGWFVKLYNYIKDAVNKRRRGNARTGNGDTYRRDSSV